MLHAVRVGVEHHSKPNLTLLVPSLNLLVGKPEGKRPLGRPRHSWVDNINMDLQ